MGKSSYSSAKREDPDTEHHGKRSKTFKCCCCRCTKSRCIKICCLATFGPIILLGIIIGIYLLVQRLSYVPPVTQVSTANDTLSFLSEMEMVVSTHNGTNQTASLTVSSQVQSGKNLFQTEVRPPWSDCGSVLATPRVVSLEVCPLNEDGRCVFPIEQDWTVEVAFTMKPNVTIHNPSFQACGKAVYLGTPCRVQPFMHPNPCNNSNVECPLQGGKSYLYRNIGGIHQKDLPVPILFDTDADMYMRLYENSNNSGRLVFCIVVPAIVKI